MKKSTIFILLIITSVAFGQTRPKPIKMQDKAKAMRQEIEKHIPLGSSLTDAQQILQANGFRCAMKQQKGFVEMSNDRSVVAHNKMDFLFCEKNDHLLINTRFWQVALLQKNGVVSDLLTSVDTSPVLRKRDYIKMSDEDIRNVLLKYAPLGSSEVDVKRTLREIFRRRYKKNSDFSEQYACYTCPSERGGFTIDSKLQHYNWRIFEVNFVWAVWDFDKNGILKEVTVRHEWDGV